MLADLRPYPEMRDSRVEWLGEIPTHWETRRVRSVARVLNGATPSTSTPAYWEGDIPWITPEDLGRLKTRYINDSARRITGMGYASCGTSLAPAQSLAISTRAPIGHIGILERAACVNQGCRLLIPDDGVHAEYLYYQLLAVRSELEALGQGSTFVELSAGKLSGFALALPPLTEQAAIVRFLDHADRRIRNYVRAKQKLIALLEEQKQAIVHQAVTGQIDVRTGQPYESYKSSEVEWLQDVPEHWDVVQLRRLALGRCDGPFGSGLKSSHYTEDGIRVLRLQNIGHGVFLGADAAFISPEHYALLGEHSVVAGDVIVAGLGDSNHPPGRACVAPEDIEPAMVKADCFRFRLDRSQIVPSFAAAQLTATAPAFSAVLSTGATRQRTNLERTSARVIGVPTMDEQLSIIDYITVQTVGVRRAQVAVEREISVLSEFRSRITSDVVTGKLDVRRCGDVIPCVDGESKTCE